MLPAKTFERTTENVTKNTVHCVFLLFVSISASGDTNTLASIERFSSNHTLFLARYNLLARRDGAHRSNWSVLIRVLQRGSAKFYQWKI
jgi:hypothetical protein